MMNDDYPMNSFDGGEPSMNHSSSRIEIEDPGWGVADERSLAAR